MSDDGPRQRPKAPTGPATFVPKPTGNWEIYSVQRQLPGVDDEAHNYLALVGPDGKIDSEMQGVYTRDFSLGKESGNYLKVEIWRPNTWDWLVEALEQMATEGWQAAAEGIDVTPRTNFPDGITSCKEYRAT